MSPTAARRPSRRSKAKAAATPAPTRPFVAHHLAPPHEVLGEEETKKVLAELQTPPERLPRILATDPGLRTDPRYEALKGSGENLVGRLVRVRRPSSTAGEAIAYRLIVQAIGGD
jgi:DNA-directed RNA polymerase subunit H (RpoH/RPB5)